MESDQRRPGFLKALARLIFFSRWLQAPLYFGLIVVQGVYVYHFFLELVHLVFGIKQYDEKDLITTVLNLIDIVMISNLLIMVVVGGYETFVSRLELRNHPDVPEWLSHVNAGVLKVKLAMALIGISSIHLLATFVHLDGKNDLNTVTVILQIAIHMTFVVSALLLAWTDRINSHIKTSAH